MNPTVHRLPIRTPSELAMDLRLRASQVGGVSWERDANQSMMQEAAVAIDNLETVILSLRLELARCTATEKPVPDGRVGMDASDEDRWYREGIAGAMCQPLTAPLDCPYSPGIAEHWWRRGFQWMSANLDRERLKAELAALREQLHSAPNIDA